MVDSISVESFDIVHKHNETRANLDLTDCASIGTLRRTLSICANLKTLNSYSGFIE